MTPAAAPGRRWRGMPAATLRAYLGTAAWVAAGLLLDMGIRELWLRMGIGLPSWGGLYLDMTGVAVVGLARGGGHALCVVILNQIFRMGYGQVSNAFVPVEIAGAIYWGWMWGRQRVCFDWRRPWAVIRTFLLAAIGGGAWCGFAAWLVNLILRGEWDFMPVQQALYATPGWLGYLGALPGEMALSIWDKSATCLLAFAVLVPLFSLWDAAPDRAGARVAQTRHYWVRINSLQGLLALWGGFLFARTVQSLLSPPVAIDFVVLRQALLINAAFLLLCFLVTWVPNRNRIRLSRAHFTLGWITASTGGLLFFVSGLYFMAHALSGSVYQSVWQVEGEVASQLIEDPSYVLPEGMERLSLSADGGGVPEGFRFVSRTAARRDALWGDLTDEMAVLFPEEGRGVATRVEGFLQTPQGLQLALLAPSEDGETALLVYQEAPWVFSHGYRNQLVPSLAALTVLTVLVLLLFFMLARQMLHASGEAVLGRQARALAQRIRARNQALERVQAEMEVAVRNRDASIRELSSLAEIGKAVGILAHEIRNPIGTVQMAFGNLLDSLGADTSGELQEQVVIIERQIRYMNLLTQSVLAFSRSAAGAGGEPAQCTAEALLDTCRNLSEPLAKRHGVTLSLEAPGGEIAVFARENEVLLILQNLVTNAVEALAEMPPGRAREVRLRARRENGTAVLTVADNGLGIGEADLEKIWDLFFTKKSSGSGLGLPVARELARLLRGDLRVRSEVGHGTTFELSLPAAP